MNDTCCPQCAGEALPLGTLGNTRHLRCRDCGWTFSESKPAQSKRELFLVEFYTTNPKTGEGGWDINFAWVFAESQLLAIEKLRSNQGPRFDEVIQTGQHARIVPLAGNFRVNTPDANLFILA